MKPYYSLVLLLPGLLAGCGQPSVEPTPATALPGAEAPADLLALEEAAPSSELPPPVFGDADAATGVTATTATEPPLEDEMVDEEGQPLTVLQFLQQAVETYDRSRAGTETEDSDGWPELTDLSQLVKFRIISRLPPAPPGKKFVFNPETQTVVVANQ